MPELRTGFDYHLAEAKKRLGDQRQTIGWQARCEACGWVGPLRAHKGVAETDAYEHDNTENA